MSISARTIDTNYPPLVLLFLYLWAGRCVCERRSAVSFIHHACLHTQRRLKEHRNTLQHSTENCNYSRNFISLCRIFRFSQRSCNSGSWVVSRNAGYHRFGETCCFHPHVRILPERCGCLSARPHSAISQNTNITLILITNFDKCLFCVMTFPSRLFVSDVTSFVDRPVRINYCPDPQGTLNRCCF